MFKQIQVASICNLIGHFLSSVPSESSPLVFFLYVLTSYFSFPSVNIGAGLMCSLQKSALGLTAHIGGHAHIFFFIIHC